MMISITACLLTTNWSMWVTLRREKTSSLSVSGDYNDDVCDDGDDDDDGDIDNHDGGDNIDNHDDDDNIDNHDGAWLDGREL